MIKQLTQALSYISSKDNVNILNTEKAVCLLFLADRLSMRLYNQSITNLSYLIMVTDKTENKNEDNTEYSIQTKVSEIMWNFRPNSVEEEYMDKYIKRSDTGIESIDYDNTILTTNQLECINKVYEFFNNASNELLLSYVMSLIEDFIKELAIIFLPEDFLEGKNDTFFNQTEEELVELRTKYKESLVI